MFSSLPCYVNIQSNINCRFLLRSYTASRGVIISVVVLSLLALIGCMVLLVTNSISVQYVISDLQFEDAKIFFKDIISYRYLIATAAIGAAYTLLQLPLASYHAWTGKRITRDQWLLEFEFYGDKVISLLLGTGVGAGFAVRYELKRIVSNLFEFVKGLSSSEVESSKSKYNDFLNRVLMALGILLFGFICMALLSIISSLTRSPTKSTFWG